MTQAPSIKEAWQSVAKRYLDDITDDLPPEVKAPTHDELGDALLAALATLQPDGERLEAIARIICYWDEPSTCHDNYCVFSCRAKTPDARFFKAADAILASGLVQNEAAIRADEREKCVAIISSPPNVPETQRFTINGEVFKDSRGNELFIAKADAETLLNDFVAAIRSARDGGAET